MSAIASFLLTSMIAKQDQHVDRADVDQHLGQQQRKLREHQIEARHRQKNAAEQKGRIDGCWAAEPRRVTNTTAADKR